MRATLTVTAKGQVTLRRELLAHLGVAPGDRIAFDLLPSGRAEISAAKPDGRIKDFFGCLPHTDRELSIEEMNQIIAEGWAGLIP